MGHVFNLIAFPIYLITSYIVDSMNIAASKYKSEKSTINLITSIVQFICGTFLFSGLITFFLSFPNQGSIQFSLLFSGILTIVLISLFAITSFIIKINEKYQEWIHTNINGKYQEWVNSNIVDDNSYKLNNGKEFEDIGIIIENLLNDSFRQE